MRVTTSMTAAACVLWLGVAGCAIPIRNKVTGGHRYPHGALAFLRLPGTTRDEVIATLGPPAVDLHDKRILLYQWEETPRYLVCVPHIVHKAVEPRPEVQRSYPEQFGLFIAYDEHGFVAAHEVRKIRTRTLEEACVNWKGDRIKSP